MALRPDMSNWEEEVGVWEVTIAVKVPKVGEPENKKDMDILADKVFKEWKSIVMSFDRGVGRLRVDIKKKSGGAQ